MVDLLVVVVVVAIPVLYAMDRVIKARAQARRLRNMTDRLAAATARTDEQQEKQQAVARASAELTSLMPAIKRPPLSLPDEASADEASHAEASHAERSHAEPSHAEPSAAEPSAAETGPQRR